MGVRTGTNAERNNDERLVACSEAIQGHITISDRLKESNACRPLTNNTSPLL
jgi:hypothetical protein